MNFKKKSKKSIVTNCLFTMFGLSCFLFTSCKKEEINLDLEKKGLNEYLNSMTLISSKMPAEKLEAKDSSRIDSVPEYIYHTDYYKAAAGYDEQIVLNPQTDVIFPGALIKGESVLDGTYTLISAKRNPITISTSLIGSPATSVVISDPKLSTIREAVNSLMKQDYDVPYANMAFTIEQANSEQQLDLSLHASYKGGGLKVSGGFDFANKKVKTRLIAKFIQSYYTLDMDMPSQPSDLFNGDVNKTLFGTFMPMYVSTVTFGRMALFTIESSLDETQVKAVLNASYGGSTGSATSEFASMMASSTMKVYILGGSGADASASINGFEDFKKYITAGGSFSKTSPGAPISYKLRYIKDNSIGKIVFAASYPIVTAIPRTDNVLYDIKTSLSKMKLNISDAGGNAEIYGTIKSWTKGLGEDNAHVHYYRSSDKYQSFGEKEDYTFPANTDTELSWNGLKQSDIISVRIAMSEADTGSDDVFTPATFEIKVADIVTGMNQGVYERSDLKVNCGTAYLNFTFKFAPVIRRIK